jgi:hypothetical protein
MWVVLVRFIRSTCEIIQEVNIEKNKKKQDWCFFFFFV